ncbi:2-C-methyl-D-erythritol 4-phosphate cytidylyltransferase [Motilibacter peucedani]|uniref:2-C-methyl-D-erythritol 4-phosphate cytidylyltransferase n=1 Tax=Motilibacter peucedani TaxID=598650 RepID=A0A420XT36_9ACTN|nr:2-C-methyl-D-erythritol 4-phosphate cytidylyltransferase [Motilibacter peucedani]RKS79974.1 2-C-methyl-D-erythritol 4-phosphate cytidylyltransferase [Motilibacter peucedani]
MPAAVLVPAAGRGERLGPGAPKALRALAGEPLLVHAVRALAAAPSVGLVVVAAPADAVEQVRALLAGVVGTTALEVVAGAGDRQGSVTAALAAVPAEVDVVLVHDAARPLVPVALVEAVVAAVRSGAPAVVPGVPLSDTVKRVDADGVVVETPERAHLRAVQTPQGFAADVLRAAHAAAGGGPVATDDAGLVERLGHPVRVVPGSPDALKVTHPLDLVLAEAVLAGRRGAAHEAAALHQAAAVHPQEAP